MKGKHIPGIDCSAPAEQMMRHVLHEQMAAMCRLRKEALHWEDPEGVHGMRVLSRRLRSTITDFKPYLRKTRLPITRLRTIARSLGGVRDEDVALAALEKLKTETHGLVAQGIEILINERQTRREKARSELKRAIRRSEITELLEDFEDRLRPPTPSPEAPKEPEETVEANQALEPNEASEPVEPVAKTETPVGPTFQNIGARIIAERIKELRAVSPHIFFPFDHKELHELRILAKGLRYAAELFANCWGQDLRAIAKEIAQLQTSLGELHDCDVWMADLGSRLKRLARRGRTDPDHIRAAAACTWLLKHFAKIRTEHYRDALGRWQQWEADGFLDSLKSVIGSG